MPGGSVPVDGGTAAGSTMGVLCDYSYSAFNGSPSVNTTSTVAWSCTAAMRMVSGNGIPDHEVGTFPNAGNPLSIMTQMISATMTLFPVNTGNATPYGVGAVGYAINGVKFDPSTAGTCRVENGQTSCSLIGVTGTWHIEALGQSSFNFGVDSNNAHVQPGGAYHYHGMPEGTLKKLGNGERPTLVGYATDGFPVYARYGYSSPMDASSFVKVMKGSYQLKATPESNRPPTTTYPMGAFTEDYEYIASSGDLDECNGRMGVTPEFPAGMYHYYITDTYPFIQRCLKGTFMPGGGMMGGPVDGGAFCTELSCAANQVCCPSGQPCAGQCVPDCRDGGLCPPGLTCNTALGFCTP
jgi:hypothetical protein